MKLEIDTKVDSYVLWQKAKELIEFAYENERSEASSATIRKLERVMGEYAR